MLKLSRAAAMGAAALCLFGAEAAQAQAAPTFGKSAATKLSGVPGAGIYYVRLRIDAELDDAAVAQIQSKKKSPFAHLVWKEAKGFSVLPTIHLNSTAGKTDIPSVPVMSVGVNDAPGAGQAWSTVVEQDVVTPWVRLDTATTIRVDFTVQGFKSQEWKAFSAVLPAALQAYGALGGQLSKTIVAGDVLTAGAAIDTAVNTFREPTSNLPRTVSDNLIFDPLGDQSVGYAVELRSPSNAGSPVVGRANVTLEFMRSFAAPVAASQAIPPAVGAIPEGVKLSTQLFRSSGGALAPVQSQGFYNAIQTAVADAATGKSAFKARCEEFRSGAAAMTLSSFDANLTLLEALTAAGWSKRIDLLSSGCFSPDEAKELAAAGRPVPVVTWPPASGENLQMSDAQMRAVANYLAAAAGAGDDGLTLASVRLLDNIYVDVQETALFGSVRETDQQPAKTLLQEWADAGVVASCCIRPAKAADGAAKGPGSAPARQQVLLLKPEPALNRPEATFAVVEFWTTPFSDNRAGRALIRPATAAEAAAAKTFFCGKDATKTLLSCTAPPPATSITAVETKPGA